MEYFRKIKYDKFNKKKKILRFCGKFCFRNPNDTSFPPRTSKISRGFQKSKHLFVYYWFKTVFFYKMIYICSIQSVQVVCFNLPPALFQLTPMTGQVEKNNLMYISRWFEKIINFMCCFYSMVYKQYMGRFTCKQTGAILDDLVTIYSNSFAYKKNKIYACSAAILAGARRPQWMTPGIAIVVKYRVAWRNVYIQKCSNLGIAQLYEIG